MYAICAANKTLWPVRPEWESRQLLTVWESSCKKLEKLTESTAANLEQIRLTVDEKLQSTLERRLGESFQQVSLRLEQVHRGLGEMQTLAGGVGDLKRILSNVKNRGIWGEMQLGVLLRDLLAPEQFAENVAVKQGTAERVEFALKLPGSKDETVWLPIDAKFPQGGFSAPAGGARAG